MLDDIIFDSMFLTFETDEISSSDPITAYSFDGESFDYIPSSSGGEVSVVFIN